MTPARRGEKNPRGLAKDEGGHNSSPQPGETTSPASSGLPPNRKQRGPMCRTIYLTPSGVVQGRKGGTKGTREQPSSRRLFENKTQTSMRRNRTADGGKNTGTFRHGRWKETPSRPSGQARPCPSDVARGTWRLQPGEYSSCDQVGDGERPVVLQVKSHTITLIRRGISPPELHAFEVV